MAAHSSPNELEQAIAQAAATLEQARDAHERTKKEVLKAYEAHENLVNQRTAALLEPRRPEEIFTDDALREYVIAQDWNGGRGDRLCSDFLKRAIESTAPGDFYEYQRFIGDDNTVSHVAPCLKLSYQQDVTAAHDALLRMHPVFAHDGLLHVDVFEHDLSEHGSIGMTVADESTATVTRNRQPVFTGTLRDALEHVAEEYWYDGGPRRRHY